ncbi:MAG: aspartyl/glutamyl-tRNA(Asn/Gln) amidotransferase subunit C [marine bacterium B5-7]|nr:MAG: aspartyl/glutamyl-tRNA(Asn/Gln) amidotransferase subunit C [marine bacterium B5-7]
MSETLSQEQVRKIAHLARLQLSDEEVDAFSESLTDILAFVDVMASEDTNGVAPLAHPRDMVQRMRADKVTETNQRELFQANSQVEDGLYLVPKVLDTE